MSLSLNNLGVISTRFADLPALFAYNAGADSLATISVSGYFNSAAAQINSGDKIIINSIDANLNFSGTLLKDSSSNITVAWDNTQYVQASLVNVSAAPSATYRGIATGVVVEVGGVLDTAITVASAVINFSLGATAITGGSLTFTAAMTAGTIVTAIPTALNVSAAGTPLKVASTGASTTTSIGNFWAKVIRGMTA